MKITNSQYQKLKAAHKIVREAQMEVENDPLELALFDAPLYAIEEVMERYEQQVAKGTV